MKSSDSVRLEAVARVLRQALVLAEGNQPKPPASENASVEFLLSVLQAESARLEEAKKEVAKKDAQLELKLTFAKNKEKELADKESDLDKFEAQLRIRESQLQRREDTLKSPSSPG
jgi:septal ring factor EnvC (AmiA/AmiB activator)